MLAATAQTLNEPVATPRLRLEPLTSAHADVLFTPLQDERIYRWISALPPKSLESVREVWDQRGSRLSPDGKEMWLNWAVRRSSDGVYVGRFDVTVDALGVATNIGYVFFPEFWGQGYASESVCAVVEQLGRQGVVEFHAFVTAGNVASERVLARAGFVRTRVIPNNDEIRGVLHDDIEYVFHSARQ